MCRGELLSYVRARVSSNEISVKSVKRSVEDIISGEEFE